MEIKDLKVLMEIRRAAATGHARQVRIDAGLTQNEVAATVGVAQATIAQWEAGNRTPRGDAALRYAQVIRTFEKINTAST